MKTWDKPGFSPYFTQWKPDFTGFVPGTNPVCPWDNPGDERRHRKFMSKKFMCLFRLLDCITYRKDILRMFSRRKEHANSSKMTKNIFCWMTFVAFAKKYYKLDVSGNDCVEDSARVVSESSFVYLRACGARLGVNGLSKAHTDI